MREVHALRPRANRRRGFPVESRLLIMFERRLASESRHGDWEAFLPGGQPSGLISGRNWRTLANPMAEPKENLQMEKIVSLCKRRGFVFQSSEIYGGINGFWDYGPLGAELKRNVKELWWHAMTRQRDDVAGLEATIIMSPQIWKASGHVDTFADLMRECPLTKKRVRADQVEPQSGIAVSFEGSVSKYNFDLAMTVCSALLKQESEEARKSMLLNIATQFVSAKKP